MSSPGVFRTFLKSNVIGNGAPSSPSLSFPLHSFCLPYLNSCVHERGLKISRAYCFVHGKTSPYGTSYAKSQKIMIELCLPYLNLCARAAFQNIRSFKDKSYIKASFAQSLYFFNLHKTKVKKN